MKKKQQNTNALPYIVGIAVACVVISFVIGWFYFKPKLRELAGPDMAFSSAEPIQIQNRGYVFVAKLSFETSKDDAKWAKEHQQALQTALHQALMNVDPKVLRAPGGLPAVQQSLAETVNRSLDRPRIQRVWFTDFVSQTDVDQDYAEEE